MEMCVALFTVMVVYIDVYIHQDTLNICSLLYVYYTAISYQIIGETEKLHDSEFLVNLIIQNDANSSESVFLSKVFPPWRIYNFQTVCALLISMRSILMTENPMLSCFKHSTTYKKLVVCLHCFNFYSYKLWTLLFLWLYSSFAQVQQLPVQCTVCQNHRPSFWERKNKNLHIIMLDDEITGVYVSKDSGY